MGVGVAMMVMGTGMSVYSQYQSAQAAGAAGDYNKKIADNEATATENAAAVKAKQMQAQKRSIEASQLVKYANSGSMAGEGTSLIVMAEQSGEMEADIAQEQYNATQKAKILRDQGTMSAWEGKQAKTSALWGAGSTLLSGASSAGSAYTSSKQS